MGPGETAGLDGFLGEWERWSAEVLESHLSYPILCFFRSQHSNQSWLASLTLVLDVSALVIVGVGNDEDQFRQRQARLTFAMARYAVGDLSQVLNTPPTVPKPDRLPPADVARLRELLAGAGIALREGAAAERQLAELRRLYEPYVNAMAQLVLLALPAWLPDPGVPDDWETTPWQGSPEEAVDALLGDAEEWGTVAARRSR